MRARRRQNCGRRKGFRSVRRGEISRKITGKIREIFDKNFGRKIMISLLHKFQSKNLNNFDGRIEENSRKDRVLWTRNDSCSYIQQAYQLYSMWGSVAKQNQIKSQFHDYLLDIMVDERAMKEPNSSDGGEHLHCCSLSIFNSKFILLKEI
jgi:hypothetical protein